MPNFFFKFFPQYSMPITRDLKQQDPFTRGQLQC